MARKRYLRGREAEKGIKRGVLRMRVLRKKGDRKKFIHHRNKIPCNGERIVEFLYKDITDGGGYYVLVLIDDEEFVNLGFKEHTLAENVYFSIDGALDLIIASEQGGYKVDRYNQVTNYERLVEWLQWIDENGRMT